MNGLSLLRHNGVVSRPAMSCAKFTCVFVFVCFGSVYGNESDLRRIDAIQSEQSCLQAGGMCTVATDCPDGHLSEQRGLCPKQKNQGVECCHGISMKETRCGKHGGICVSLSQNYCNPRLVFDGATDCLDDKRCCIMV